MENRAYCPAQFNAYSNVFNLTPNCIDFYTLTKDHKAEKIYSFISFGELLMKTTVKNLPTLFLSIGQERFSCPQITAPKYDALEPGGEAYDLFTNYKGVPAIFLVSLEVAQYLEQNRHLIPEGCLICTPYMDKHVNGTFTLITHNSPIL